MIPRREPSQTQPEHILELAIIHFLIRSIHEKAAWGPKPGVDDDECCMTHMHVARGYEFAISDTGIRLYTRAKESVKHYLQSP